MGANREMVGAAELLKLFEDMEKQVEGEAPIPFYRKLIKHYDKAIQILAESKHTGEALTHLETERYRLEQTMGKQIAARFVINLRGIKDDLKREAEE